MKVVVNNRLNRCCDMVERVMKLIKIRLARFKITKHWGATDNKIDIMVSGYNGVMMTRYHDVVL